MKRLVNSGDLRHRVAIQEPIETQDSITGSISRTFQTVNDERGYWGSLPAAKMPLSAREFEAAAAIQAQTSTRFVVRWLPGIVPKMRLICEGRIYNINGAMEDQDTGRDYITLSCTEGVNDG